MIQKNMHFHFVGIGGIGMSSLAAIVRQLGHRVSGCDADCSQKSIKNLISLGCTIFEGNNTQACNDSSIDTLVYSTAIQKNNPELDAARKRGIPVIHRAALLAELTQKKTTIAIAGSHGKTTTTALVAHVLTQCNQDPTVIVGGIMHNFNSNARFGKSALLVAEADESDRSFTQLYPSIAIITNIDLEHLDTYRDKTDLKHTFQAFLERLPRQGKAFVCIDTPLTREFLEELPPSIRQNVVTYGLSADATIRLENPVLEEQISSGTIVIEKIAYPITVPLAGIHNLLNATATFAVAKELGLSLSDSNKALETFLGVDQRFTYRGTFLGAEIFDDYGHHPTEIAHVLEVAKKRSKGRVIVVFQPHRFTRTEKLWDDFVTVFSTPTIAQLILTDIHPASETPIEGITGKQLALAIASKRNEGTTVFTEIEPNYEPIINKLKEVLQENDLLLFLGAGKINRLAEKLCKK